MCPKAGTKCQCRLIFIIACDEVFAKRENAESGATALFQSSSLLPSYTDWKRAVAQGQTHYNSDNGVCIIWQSKSVFQATAFRVPLSERLP